MRMDIEGETPESVQERGMRVVRLHQALEDWRDRRRLGLRLRWDARAATIIGAEIARLEREIDQCARLWDWSS